MAQQDPIAQQPAQTYKQRQYLAPEALARMMMLINSLRDLAGAGALSALPPGKRYCPTEGPDVRALKEVLPVVSVSAEGLVLDLTDQEHPEAFAKKVAARIHQAAREIVEERGEMPLDQSFLQSATTARASISSAQPCGRAVALRSIPLPPFAQVFFDHFNENAYPQLVEREVLQQGMAQTGASRLEDAESPDLSEKEKKRREDLSSARAALSREKIAAKTKAQQEHQRRLEKQKETGSQQSSLF